MTDLLTDSERALVKMLRHRVSKESPGTYLLRDDLKAILAIIERLRYQEPAAPCLPAGSFVPTGEVRAPKKGEWYQSLYGGVIPSVADESDNAALKRPIYRRIDTAPEGWLFILAGRGIKPQSGQYVCGQLWEGFYRASRDWSAWNYVYDRIPLRPPEPEKPDEFEAWWESTPHKLPPDAKEFCRVVWNASRERNNA